MCKNGIVEQCVKDKAEAQERADATGNLVYAATLAKNGVCECSRSDC
jgi:alcohol dehydrogenase YqhD (iron-dependent ADH family)